MTIYWTSDFHYNHINITGPKVSNWESGYRDFDSVQEMNSAIVKSINSIVLPSDHLYHLGDWSFGGKHNIKLFREQINCNHITLIRGNHDKHIDEFRNLFVDILDYKEIHLNRQMICMSHYPFSVWNKRHHGSWMLSGHCHGSFYPSTKECLDQGKILDIGWCSFRKPLNFEEIKKIMDKKFNKQIDHHNGNTAE